MGRCGSTQPESHEGEMKFLTSILFAVLAIVTHHRLAKWRDNE